MKQKYIEEILNEKKLRKKKDMQQAQLKASCDHKKEKNGHTISSLKPISDDGFVLRCSICDERVDLHELNLEEIRKAANIVKSAIEAIKVCEDDISDDILLQFGMTKLLLSRLDIYYKDLVLERMKEDEFETSVDFNNPIQNMMLSGNPMFQMVNNPQQYLNGIYGGGYNNNKKKKHKNKDNYNKHKNNKRDGYSWY